MAKIKDLLLIISAISLFKIAFWGINTNITTSRINGIPVNVSIDEPIMIDGDVAVEGKELSRNPLEIIIER